MNLATKDKEKELLNVLRQLGKGWHSRKDIAAAMGKNRLNGAEAALLDVMADAGKIEKSMAQTKVETVNRWQYRIKE
jgi:hypothetical protein